jgi:hypothetical protein
MRGVCKEDVRIEDAHGLVWLDSSCIRERRKRGVILDKGILEREVFASEGSGESIGY